MRDRTLCAVILFIFSQSPGGGREQNAQQQFEQLQQEANAERKSGDLRARLQTVLKMERLLNDAPDAVEAVAGAYTDIGDTEHAFSALNQFADLGQADERMLAGTSKTFAGLAKLSEYQLVVKRMAANKTPVSRAESVFTLDDPGILAEDIDYDAQAKSFLITGVLEKKIIRVAADGKVMDFAQSPSHWPMLAIKVDAEHKLVWATEVALYGFTVAPKSDWGRSAVVCFDLQTGALRRRIEGPPKSALGDMVVTTKGDPIVSDGGGGGVYRVSGDQLQRIDAGDFISPQTPTMHPDGKHVFVPDYARGIGILDLASKQVVWLNQGAPKFAINGIDGLYFDRGSLIATQNGTSPERVVRFQLDPSLSRIVSEEIIERATTSLGDPTHGVVVGDFFYYIANSGWSELDDNGNVKPSSKLTPPRIMRYKHS
jgi:sugar lactone lactonase YvrE